MLTESEKRWLERRKPGDWCELIDCSAWCNRKEGRSDTPYCFSKTCYLNHPLLYRDAAEFSERCAVWLAKRCAAIEKAVQQLLGAAEYKDLDEAAEILLEGARLTVEEEMDANRT